MKKKICVASFSKIRNKNEEEEKVKLEYATFETNKNKCL